MSSRYLHRISILNIRWFFLCIDTSSSSSSSSSGVITYWTISVHHRTYTLSDFGIFIAPRALSFPNERSPRCLLLLLSLSCSFCYGIQCNVLTGHRICFFLLLFLASILSIGLPVRQVLLSLRFCLDSPPISNHILILRGFYFLFSLFLLSSSVSRRSWVTNHFRSFWLNSHDFCSSFHFI